MAADEVMDDEQAAVTEQPEEPVATEADQDPEPAETAETVQVPTPEPEPEPAPEPTFQERLDGVRDAFRSTYQTHGMSKSGVVDAKVEMDKAKVTYDGAMSIASVSRTEHLEDTRDLIRVMQEHEANLVAEAAA